MISVFAALIDVHGIQGILEHFYPKVPIFRALHLVNMRRDLSVIVLVCHCHKVNVSLSHSICIYFEYCMA